MSVRKTSLRKQADLICGVAMSCGLDACKEAANGRWKKDLARLAPVSLARPAAAFLAGTVLSGVAGMAHAQEAGTVGPHMFSSTQVIWSSLVLGALGAALLSAVWLVRQRGNMEAESARR